MLLLYDIGIRLYWFIVFLASFKNRKARAWIIGRRDILTRIESLAGHSRKFIWFHFASLGEFEQGRPVLEALKEERKDLSIVITFFSPSGFEIRKDYPLADHVFYLPVDTRRNAARFIKAIDPAFAVFTKYEFWYHYFSELKKAGIPLFLISGLFRKNQPFFKWYGALHRKMLTKVSHFFVQNPSSKELLSGIGITRVSISGDTRFDRVIKNIQTTPANQHVARFCAANPVFIAGSTWKEDEEIITGLAATHPEWKFVIAPHEVNENRISQVTFSFPGSATYSDISRNSFENSAQVLIIDTIGILATLYQYADIAYIGGGFGTGIHNTQEAAAFGLPVIFGPKYHKFQEAADLIRLGGAFSVQNEQELKNTMSKLTNEPFRRASGKISAEYVSGKAGATAHVINYLRKEKYI